MNYYGGDMVKYFEDKANIYKYQRQGDVLVVGEQVEKIQDSPNSRAKLATGQARFKIQERDGKVIARASDVPSMWKVKLLGEHNRLNIACAIKVARALKIDVEDIKEVVENFEGVEGRLQFLREVNGVKIYNDNNSTTPEATMAALKAVHGDLRFKSKDSRGEDKSIILIMGGADKNLDMTELIVEIPKYCKSVIMLPGSGSEKLHAKRNTLHASVVDVADLNQAVQKGMELARRGDVLLFSPAFASFGPPPGGFKNEYDRGEQFVRIANSL
jgi:UDP-N-acetylmuramoylalanine--D-glutamate ligase